MVCDVSILQMMNTFSDFVDSLVTNAAASFTVTERSKPLHRIDNVTTIDELFKVLFR